MSSQSTSVTFALRLATRQSHFHMSTSQQHPAKSTPDLLTATGAKASLSAAAVSSVRNWLAGQLVAQEFAKLGQGGHKESQIPLKSVFVDLPVARENLYISDHQRQQLLSRLMNGRLLDFSNAISKASKEVTDGPQEKVQDDFSATLLIGGPGQGKSTIGQLASQLYRAFLLEASTELLNAREADLVKSFARQTTGRSKRDLAHPRRPLFPLTLELPKVASWLSEARADSESAEVPRLIRYLTELPSAREVKLHASHLWQFVRRIPVFVVLDGFDEVGATKEREAVVEAARELFEALAQQGNSGHILATTRPQGYADEFSAMGVRLTKWFLLPLEQGEALNYAKKLVEAKVADVDLQQQALRRLKEAAQEPATQRLLKTPLQVTILTALVQQLGGVPRERWNLFSRYFSYTYDREIERKSFASSILLSHRNHIERIHARVALLLQVEAESVGGAEARMSRQRLEEVIVEVLREDEIAEETQDRLVKQISKAAEQRLVFLVEPEPGRFGFEIRSLQEFMAAWALTDGRDTDVVQRMSQVARAPMFRNVLVFVASRLYSNSSPLRENIGKICDELNNPSFDELSAASKAGSVLAIDVIEEGAISSQPRQSRAIMERAVNLLERPLATDHYKLAIIADKDNEATLAGAIRGILSKSELSDASIEACWNCLIAADYVSKSWAFEILLDRQELFISTRQLLAKSSRFYPDISERIESLLEANSQKINPFDVIDFSFGSRDAGQSVSWLSAMAATLGGRANNHYRHFMIINLADRLHSNAPQPPRSDVPKGWESMAACLRYEVSPDARSLGAALRQLAQVYDSEYLGALSTRVSWPMAACLNSAGNASDLLEIASKLESGALGDTPLWLRAEKQWNSALNLDAVLEVSDVDLPWSTAKLHRAPPLMAIPVWILKFEREGRDVKLATLRRADNILRTCRSSQLRERIASICLLLLPDVAARTLTKYVDVRYWLEVSPSSVVYLASKPRSLSQQEWLDSIEGVSVESVRVWNTGLVRVIQSFNASPWHPLAVEAVVMALGIYAKGSRKRLFHDEEGLAAALKVWREERPKNILENPKLIIVGYLAGVIDPAQDIVAVDGILAGSGAQVDIWPPLIGALHYGGVEGSRVERILLEGLRVAPGSTHLAEALKERLQSRRSGLEQPGTWNRLNLPPPRPSGNGDDEFYGFGSTELPIHVKEVQLLDVGRIRQLLIRPNPSSTELGQWVVILGQNGTGKSTLLKSLALSLRNLKNPAIWPRGTFGSVWRRVSRGNSPTTEGTIEITLNEGQVFRTSVRSDDASLNSQSPPRTGTSPFPIFAYGCRRGSAMGGVAREVNLESDDGPEIATLFDEDSFLVHAETWLIALEGDASKSTRSARIFGAVIESLRVLLDLEYIDVADKKVWIKEVDGPRLHISSLSDGYLTTAGWFLDLIARWVEHPERRALDFADNFLTDMTGLVLIDEIDLHLHPRWQMDVIARTRKVLPRMSFWVTTHNPLCLVGAKAEEIWMLDRRGEDTEVSSGKEAPLLLTSGQIYKKYFGIADIYPDELGRVLQRYAFLFAIEGKSVEERHEMNRLASILKENGALPEWNASPQSVVGRSYDD